MHKKVNILSWVELKPRLISSKINLKRYPYWALNSIELNELTWLDLTWLDLTWLDLTWLDLTWFDLKPRLISSKINLKRYLALNSIELNVCNFQEDTVKCIMWCKVLIYWSNFLPKKWCSSCFFLQLNGFNVVFVLTFTGHKFQTWTSSGSSSCCRPIPRKDSVLQPTSNVVVRIINVTLAHTWSSRQ